MNFSGAGISKKISREKLKADRLKFDNAYYHSVRKLLFSVPYLTTLERFTFGVH
jgi:hypothetical protein